MAKLELLTSAIAEAKQVKKTAMANAKLALEETFQPTFQRMISAKLQEEDDEFSMDDDELDIDVQSVEPEEEAEPQVGFGGGEEEPEPEEEEQPDQELESLLRELEGSLEDEMPDEMTEEDEIPMEEGEDEFMMDEGDDMSDEDLLEMLMSEMEGEDETLEEENCEDGSAFTETPPNPQMNSEVRRLRNENKKLVKEKNEAYRAITILKSAINETNLLNAKLMYVTKTLRQYPLNENQQSRVMDSFDRAKTVREVKLVYTTIVESFNKKPQAKKKMVEGSASKPTKAINPTKSNASTLNESLTVNRFQELAGIKKIQF